MNGKAMIALAGIIFTLVFGGIAFAGIPCGSTSILEATPDCGAYCPRGDLDAIEVEVTVKDAYGNVLPGQIVSVMPIIEYYAPDDSGHYFCPPDRIKTGTTNALGKVTVVFDEFGGCDCDDCGLEFMAIASGMVLGPSNRVVTASPDSDADGDVDLGDFIYFAGSYLRDDCCADYNCDGVVSLIDFITFTMHYFHTCR
jgi:hypothetical protein